MNELDTAIYSRLAAATALTALLGEGSASLFHLQAKPQAVYPYVVWNIQGGGDINDNPHRTKEILLFVRNYSKVDAAQAGTIDGLIDSALHMAPFSNVTGWTNTWLSREQDLEAVENPPTQEQVFMQGGTYRSRLAK